MSIEGIRFDFIASIFLGGIVNRYFESGKETQANTCTDPVSIALALPK